LDFKPFKMGKYLLLERLATGGMAEVYRARAQGAGGFEKQVAIKRILPSYSQNDEFRKMFEYEARLSSMLTQANIVQIFDFNKFGETYLLAMEYIDGKNLRQFINKARKVNVTYPIEFSVFVINEVCKGLEYAHAKKDEMTGKALNIIHRDMSPQNIMLSYEGAVKIVDFGIAKAKDRVDETRSGIIKGKFGYMSPEQANGQQVDHRTDIFSTGIILWELLTGRRLFAAESDMATLRMIQECVITPPSKINPRVTPDLERIVMKILSKDLKLRYSSAGDLHRHLLEYLSKNASAYTQREVSETLQKAFAEEIEKEKKRFEALNRQSIPFSQGTPKRNRDDDGMDDIADALDGMQTKSDIVEETGETFGDEGEGPDSPEVSAISRQPKRQEESDRTAVSYTVDENEGDESLDSIADELSQATKSQLSIPTEGPVVEEVDTEAKSASVSNEKTEISQPGVEPPSYSREPAKRPSADINLKHGQKDLDLVLPGGVKHQFSRDTGTGPAKRGLVLEPEDPPSPANGTRQQQQQWKAAQIVPMDEVSQSSQVSEPLVPPDNELQISQSSIAEFSVSKSMEIPTPPAPRTSAASPERHPIAPATLGLEMESPSKTAPLMNPNGQRANWGQRSLRDNRFTVRRKKRLIHPIIPLLFVLALTGYVYKLYLDGAVGEFIEKNNREPTQSPRAPDVGDEPIDSASVDRKPVGDCTLEVRSQPSGALVRENKEDRGLTPTVLSGPCNRSVNIELTKDGYEYLSENVLIGPKATEWARALKPIPTGHLVISLGFNASVFVNGDHLRDARARVPLDLPLRAHRTHSVRLVNPTLKLDVETSVQIEEGKNTPLSLSLDEALAQGRRSAAPARKKRSN
jgi:serine/threonine protein kinase